MKWGRWREMDVAKNQQILSPGFGRVLVKISSPYYSSWENLGLEYKVKGLDEEWRPVPINGELQFNRITAGKYILMVRYHGMNRRDDMFHLTLTVNPWFYNTWWFYAITTLFVFLATLAVVRFRIRLLKRRNRKLKAVIKKSNRVSYGK